MRMRHLSAVAALVTALAPLTAALPASGLTTTSQPASPGRVVVHDPRGDVLVLRRASDAGSVDLTKVTYAAVPQFAGRGPALRITLRHQRTLPGHPRMQHWSTTLVAGGQGYRLDVAGHDVRVNLLTADGPEEFPARPAAWSQSRSGEQSVTVSARAFGGARAVSAMSTTMVFGPRQAIDHTRLVRRTLALDPSS